MIWRNIFFCAAVLFTVLTLSAFSISAQGKPDRGSNFCSDNWNWNGKIPARELRNIVLPLRNSLEVDGKGNGAISVRGENRNDILIRACVMVWSESKAESENAVRQIKIKTDSVVEFDDVPNEAVAVSYQIFVPLNINLKLTANNGGILVSSINGTMELSTTNGGLDLRDLAGSVTVKTLNGGVSIELSGNTWNGNGLDVETRNGGIKLLMSENFAATIETGTRNGEFKSKINGLQIEGKSRWSNNRISRNLNGGGAPVRLFTTNGGINIEAR